MFTDLPLNDSGRMGITYTRLRDIGYAWATPGTRHHHDEATLAAILDGLEVANQKIYYAGRSEFGNCCRARRRGSG
ncbi:MAG: hypothetical protein ACRDT6_15585 [Micromonosporaceae bacterium]